MISFLILEGMLQEYVPSGDGRIILAGSAGYHCSLTVEWHRGTVGSEGRKRREEEVK